MITTYFGAYNLYFGLVPYDGKVRACLLRCDSSYIPSYFTFDFQNFVSNYYLLICPFYSSQVLNASSRKMKNRKRITDELHPRQQFFSGPVHTCDHSTKLMDQFSPSTPVCPSLRPNLWLITRGREQVKGGAVRRCLECSEHVLAHQRTGNGDQSLAGGRRGLPDSSEHSAGANWRFLLRRCFPPFRVRISSLASGVCICLLFEIGLIRSQMVPVIISGHKIGTLYCWVKEGGVVNDCLSEGSIADLFSRSN